MRQIFEKITSDLSLSVNQFTAELKKCEDALDRAMKKAQSDGLKLFLQNQPFSLFCIFSKFSP
jgi:hypothetical protein